jgi:arginine exporter protein ArgO
MDESPGLKAKMGAYRTALLVAVFLLVAITVIGLQLTNLINVKEWQTLIGFGGTLFVGWIAWENVNRQLKVQRAANRMTFLSVRRIGLTGNCLTLES